MMGKFFPASLLKFCGSSKKIMTRLRWKLLAMKSFPRIIGKIYGKLHTFLFYHRNCENNSPYTTNYTSHGTKNTCFL